MGTSSQKYLGVCICSTVALIFRQMGHFPPESVFHLLKHIVCIDGLHSHCFCVNCIVSVSSKQIIHVGINGYCVYAFDQICLTYFYCAIILNQRAN